MAEHEGWLYLTTFDWGVFLPIANNPSPGARALMDLYGADQIARRAGRFEMWRSRDGVEWVPVTTNGFGNPYNYGGRTLVSTGAGLLVGARTPSPRRRRCGWPPDGPTRPTRGVARRCGGAPPWRSYRERSGRPASDMLLTGADGFLGGHLVESLLRRGVRLGCWSSRAAPLGCGTGSTWRWWRATSSTSRPLPAR